MILSFDDKCSESVSGVSSPYSDQFVVFYIAAYDNTTFVICSNTPKLIIMKSQPKSVSARHSLGTFLQIKIRKVLLLNWIVKILTNFQKET